MLSFQSDVRALRMTWMGELASQKAITWNLRLRIRCVAL